MKLELDKKTKYLVIIDRWDNLKLNVVVVFFLPSMVYIVVEWNGKRPDIWIYDGMVERVALNVVPYD